MALVPATLEASILTLMKALYAQTENPEAAAQKFAGDLAAAIDTYIKTATVTVTVATTGSATAQAGTGTGSLA